MGKIKLLKPRLATFDSRRVKPPPKTADEYLLTPEHRAWRASVIANAGSRCEAIDDGTRCPKAEPYHRMFADHIVERSDDGDRLDPANGQCLCGAHHTIKTARERSKRMRG
jgi:hypothetical protein